MPIHDAGYRPWTGPLVPAVGRWVVIAATDIRRTWKSQWLRRLVFFALMPILLLSIPFFLLEQAIQDPQGWQGAARNIANMPLPDIASLRGALSIDLASASTEELNELRHALWSFLLLFMFRNSQAVLMVMVVGIAAPPLISQDVRSRAFLIYFSKPVARLEYLLGKMGTLTFFLGMITTVPALLLYIAAVLLSPDFSTVAATWDLPVRILLASIVLIVPTSALALMYSSLTAESRYAGFAWFATWILGYVVYTVTMAFEVSAGGPLEAAPKWRSLYSPYHMLGIVEARVFDMQEIDAPVGWAVGILAAVTALSIGVLYRRISSPMRA
jgi:ABC-2 type transport system permease protein